MAICLLNLLKKILLNQSSFESLFIHKLAFYFVVVPASCAFSRITSGVAAHCPRQPDISFSMACFLTIGKNIENFD